MIGLEVINPDWNNGQFLQELKWGNLYFLNMQDSSGYVMNFCGGDDGNRWTDNIIGNSDDRPIHTEPVGRSGQYQFIFAEARLAILSHTTDPAYADTCLTAAKKGNIRYPR